jgi:hypothetical protein
MGVVADGAGLLLDGISTVHFFEGSIAALVAGKAELRRSHREEIDFRRRVREMALTTSLLYENFVRDLVIIVLFFVAFEADCIAFSAQQIR